MFARLFVLSMLLLWPAQLLAGAWTLPKGKLWTKVSFFREDTDEQYLAFDEFLGGKRRKTSSRQRYNFDGNFNSKAVFIEAFYGVTERLDLGVQIPFFNQVFDDSTRPVPPSDEGFSDIRFFSKFRFFAHPFIATFKGGVKIPTGNFRNEDGLIPVGEGQWDFDLLAQLGRSFWPLPFYTNLDVGYRIRLKNSDIDRDPGDEFLLNGELGVNLTRRLLLTGKLEWLRGVAGEDFGFRSPAQIKRITYLGPTLAYQAYGETTLQVGARFSVGGRNFPAGWQVVLGVSNTFDARKFLKARF